MEDVIIFKFFQITKIPIIFKQNENLIIKKKKKKIENQIKFKYN